MELNFEIAAATWELEAVDGMESELEGLWCPGGRDWVAIAAEAPSAWAAEPGRANEPGFGSGLRNEEGGLAGDTGEG